MLYADPAVRAGAWGLATHWYASPAQVSNLNLTHNAFPDKHVLHTEGCLCNAPSGGRVVLPGDPLWFGLGESYAFGIMSVLQNWGEGFTDWNMLREMAAALQPIPFRASAAHRHTANLRGAHHSRRSWRRALPRAPLLL